jgi:predicted nuclease with TOPRIM domain
MPIIDDADFLTNRTKQLAAVHELANLRTRLVDLQTELLNRMHERRQLIQRFAERDLARQQQGGVARGSRTTALQRARASEEVRTFDQNVAALREKIRRLEIDIERERLAIEVAVAGQIDRTLSLMRGAA